MDKRKYAMIYWNQITKKPTLAVDVTDANFQLQHRDVVLQVCTLFNGLLLIPTTSIQYIQIFELDSGSESEYDRIIKEKDPEIMMLDTAIKEE